MNPLEQLIALVTELEGENALTEFNVTTRGELKSKLATLATLYKQVKAGTEATTPEAVAALARVLAIAVSGREAFNVLEAEAADLATEAATSDQGIEAAIGDLADDDAADLSTNPEGAEATAGVEVTPVSHEEAVVQQEQAAEPVEGVEPVEIPAPADLGALQASSPAPGDKTPVVKSGIKASAGLSTHGAGQLLQEEQLAVAFEALHGNLQTVPLRADGTYTLGRKVQVGTIERAHNERTVFSADHLELSPNQLLDLATKAVIEAGKPMIESLKASGGPCAGTEPDFAVTLVGGDTANSFIDSLPVVVNNRKLEYYKWINFSMGSRPSNVLTKITTAQDTAGYYDPETTLGDDLDDAIEAGKIPLKSCIHIDCPSPSAQDYHAIYQCLTIGNFINISFPEYVDVWKRLMGAHFNVSRNEDSIATVVAASRKINVTADIFGANRDLFSIISRFVSSLRGDRHDPNLPISLYFPAFTNMWLADDAYKQMFHDEMEAIQKIAAKIPNLNIHYYDVSAGTTSAGSPTVLPALPTGAGTTAGLQTWPSQMRVLAFPTGGVFQQAVGKLSFGLRETGMDTNDFSMFNELFESTLFRSTDLYALDIKLCPQGEAAGSSVVAC